MSLFTFTTVDDLPLSERPTRLLDVVRPGDTTERIPAIEPGRVPVYFDAQVIPAMQRRANRAGMSLEQYLLHLYVADVWGKWSFDGEELAE